MHNFRSVHYIPLNIIFNDNDLLKGNNILRLLQDNKFPKILVNVWNRKSSNAWIIYQMICHKIYEVHVRII